uniref:Uncharacterized protein n=1 Tax=Glossina pallidipes TaxID=7398 RepID=A0A1A9ZD39_GLOPL
MECYFLPSITSHLFYFIDTIRQEVVEERNVILLTYYYGITMPLLYINSISDLLLNQQQTINTNGSCNSQQKENNSEPNKSYHLCCRGKGEDCNIKKKRSSGHNSQRDEPRSSKVLSKLVDSSELLGKDTTHSKQLIMRMLTGPERKKGIFKTTELNLCRPSHLQFLLLQNYMETEGITYGDLLILTKCTLLDRAKAFLLRTRIPQNKDAAAAAHITGIIANRSTTTAKVILAGAATAGFASSMSKFDLLF